MSRRESTGAGINLQTQWILGQHSKITKPVVTKQIGAINAKYKEINTRLQTKLGVVTKLN